MEKLIQKLRSVVNFKDTTVPGDVVLVAATDPEILFYAYVSDITRDTTRKDEWWHVEMHILSMPPQRITWTLRTPQMSGMETFTMGGEPRFMKAVAFNGAASISPEPVKKETSPQKGHKGFIKRIK